MQTYTKMEQKQQLTIKGQLNNVQNEDAILNLMNKFSNSKRYAFNQITKKKLKKTKEINELEKDCYQKFIPNIRYSKDAVAQAKWLIESKKETLRLHKELLKNRIENLKQKLTRAKTKHNKHFIQNKITKFQNKLSNVERLLQHDEVGKVIFGGRKNYEKYVKGELTIQDWKLFRNNELYSRADVTKKGNPNIRIIDNQLQISDPITGKKYFEDLYIPEKRKQYLDTKKYSVMIKLVGGVFKVYIASEIKSSPRYKLKNGAIGVDINPKSLNCSIISKQGNYLGKRDFNINEVNNTNTNKTINILGNQIKKIVKLAKWQNKGIVIEDLKFKDKIKGKKLNRIFSEFTYSKIIQLFESQCLKEKVEISKVNPAFTSFIGGVKYAKKYNQSIHTSASFVIGRRGLRFNEKIPNFFKSFDESLEERSKSWKSWSLLKRRLTALKTNTSYLEDKMKVFNLGENPKPHSTISGSRRNSERRELEQNPCIDLHRFL